MSDIIQSNVWFSNLVLCMQRRSGLIIPKWRIPRNELLWLQIFIQTFDCKILFFMCFMRMTLFLFFFKHFWLINLIVLFFSLLCLNIWKYLLDKIMLALSMLSRRWRICIRLLPVMLWYTGGKILSCLVV